MSIIIDFDRGQTTITKNITGTIVSYENTSHSYMVELAPGVSSLFYLRESPAEEASGIVGKTITITPTGIVTLKYKGTSAEASSGTASRKSGCTAYTRNGLKFVSDF